MFGFWQNQVHVFFLASRTTQPTSYTDEVFGDIILWGKCQEPNVWWNCFPCLQGFDFFWKAIVLYSLRDMEFCFCIVICAGNAWLGGCHVQWTTHCLNEIVKGEVVFSNLGLWSRDDWYKATEHRFLHLCLIQNLCDRRWGWSTVACLLKESRAVTKLVGLVGWDAGAKVKETCEPGSVLISWRIVQRVRSSAWPCIPKWHAAKESRMVLPEPLSGWPLAGQRGVWTYKADIFNINLTSRTNFLQ